MLGKLLKQFFSGGDSFIDRMHKMLTQHGIKILNTEKDSNDNYFFKLTKGNNVFNLQVNVAEKSGKLVVDNNIICFKFKKDSDILEEVLKVIPFLEASFDFRGISFIENLMAYYKERKQQLKSSFLYTNLSNIQLQDLQLLNLKADKFITKKCPFKG